MKSIARIYEALVDGDPLTDSEVLLGIEFFSDLAERAALVGPTYLLVARDARTTASTLNSFYTARMRNREK
jgi:hypothetical protein